MNVHLKKISNIFFKSIISIFCFFWVLKEIILPVGVGSLYSFKFMKLVNKCDTAMESSWYYKQDKTIEKSELIQMLDCHEYDKVRKLLLMSGLSEYYLSYLSLKSLDLYQKNPEEFVKQHRFREK